MKVKVTMVLDIDADTLEEAEDVYYHWDDCEFIEAASAADVTIESAE